jgi:hypothetical protein
MKTCSSRKTLRQMIIPARTLTIAVSHLGLTIAPITERRLAAITSGTRANGIPNESTTWLRTKASVGGRPNPRTIRAGASVIARRRKIGIRRWMNPCITT